MIVLWVGFFILILSLLALDLGVFQKRDHAISAKEALKWTAFWVFLALLFNVFVYFLYENQWFGVQANVIHPLGGKQAALQFLTGYIVEESLSLDNISLMVIIFSYFQIPLHLQHRVLFWGILGAQVFRLIMILGGLALLERFQWMIYVFGVFLIFTAIKMWVSSEERKSLEENPVVRWIRRLYPVSTSFDGHRFFTRMNGKRAVTPLFLVLMLIETTDIIFAVDSIPAIFAITKDPFLVFTSNIFAILGLRSLYFALAAILPKFRYLKESLVFILGFIGIKMILSHHYPIPITISLSVIVIALTLGVLASLFLPSKPSEKNLL